MIVPMIPSELETERLRLRRWKASDRAPFATMNADPKVMEFFPAVLSAGESGSFIERIEQHFAAHNFGLWAVESLEFEEFVGFVGLWPASFDAHFTPAVEVGWRLDHRFWGRGYAPEAAKRVLADGFDRLAFPEIVSFTATINIRSRRVMEKLGMRHDQSDDFDHPSVEFSSPLRRHVLYRLAPHR